MAGKKWVAPCFDATHWDFCSPSSKSGVAKPKRSGNKNIRSGKSFNPSLGKSNSNEIPWVERFSPMNKQNLIVHKKKIEQVECWLLDQMKNGKSKLNPRCPILLLTGPSGSGKTATVKVLAKEHGVLIREWEDPNKLVEEWKLGGPEVISQSSAFTIFLKQASRYGSLFLDQDSTVRILLIKEIPNSMHKESSILHTTLRKYRHSSACPLVFIISENGMEQSIELNLFPKDLQTELNMTVVNFNPITTLSICKILNFILSEVNKNKLQSTKVDVELLAESSGGDIRSAINALQFSEFKNITSSSLNNNSTKKLEHFGAKNTSLILFHSIGKVLYCKRDGKKLEPSLPKHLKSHQRLPLIEDPEDIFQRTSISAEGFNLFLHENYLDFMVNMDRASNCAQTFSEVDFLLSEWSVRDQLNNYSSSIAIRSLMFNLNLPNDNKHSRLRPFKKPQWFEVKKTSTKQLNYITSTTDFRNWSSKDLTSVILPYITLINPKGLNHNQFSTAADLSNFQKKSTGYKYGWAVEASKTVTPEYVTNISINCPHEDFDIEECD